MLDSLMISIPEYFASLKFSALMRALPGGIAQGLIWGILALGVFMTFRMLGISDLTVDGSMATGGAVCIMLVLKGVNPQLALLASFFAGMAAGVITGFLHTRLGIPDILAGILTQISLYSINLNIMGKANQAVNVNKVSFLFSSNAKLLTRTIWIVFFVCAALVGVLYLYLGTEHGSALRATGINGNMARAQGINTSRMKVIGLAISNGLVALSGGLIAQSQTFADIQMGTGSIVIGLASLIIGDTLTPKGRVHTKILGALAGSVIYRFIIAIALRLDLPSECLKLISAVIVALAIGLPAIKSAVRPATKGGKV